MMITSLQNRILKFEVLPVSFDGSIWFDLVPGVIVVSAVAANGVPAVTSVRTGLKDTYLTASV